MPRAPSTLTLLPEAREDLHAIAEHNPDHAERVLSKVHDWEAKIEWGRVPQEHLTYLTDSPPEYNFYRERVGNSGYRVVYEISDDALDVETSPAGTGIGSAGDTAPADDMVGDDLNDSLESDFDFTSTR